MRHVAVIPLIGGFAVAATNVLGKNPEMVLSFCPFTPNDRLYLDYVGGSVPYRYMDESGFDVPKDVDLVTGVPPCSGLSLASSTSCADSPVNEWMYKTLEYVLSVIRPKTYVFENAPSLYTEMGRPVRNRLECISAGRGYSVTFYRTNSLLHGVPQNRLRTYCVFLEGDRAPILKRFSRKPKSLKDFLEEIPNNAQGRDLYAVDDPFFDGYESVKFMKHRYGEGWRERLFDGKHDNRELYGYFIDEGLMDEFRSFARDPKTTESIDHIVGNLKKGKSYRSGYGDVRFFRDFVTTVYGGSMSLMAHPSENRLMNLREYMHLMGMPHGFEITAADANKIGQNVPVVTSMDMVRECVEAGAGNRSLALTNVSMQNNVGP